MVADCHCQQKFIVREWRPLGTRNAKRKNNVRLRINIMLQSFYRYRHAKKTSINKGCT